LLSDGWHEQPLNEGVEALAPNTLTVGDEKMGDSLRLVSVLQVPFDRLVEWQKQHLDCKKCMPLTINGVLLEQMKKEKEGKQYKANTPGKGPLRCWRTVKEHNKIQTQYTHSAEPEWLAAFQDGMPMNIHQSQC